MPYPLERTTLFNTNLLTTIPLESDDPHEGKDHNLLIINYS
jgi:hypothetical protein